MEANACSAVGGSESIRYLHCLDPPKPQPLPAELSVDVTAEGSIWLVVHHFQ